MAFEFPAFLKLEHLPDGSAEASFLAEVNRTLEPAERRFEQFSSEARRQLDQALSVQRNNAGSLDLDVPQLRAAAEAQQARAIAAREVATATRLAAEAEGDYSQKARLAIAATDALAREEQEAAQRALSHADALEQVQMQLNKTKSATDAVVQANSRGTTAQRNVINSSRASRVAFIQLGQQMQDVTIQAQLGTNAFQIFAQQVPQAAFALSGLEASANKTQARIGKFATFMSGPWGAAIFAATAVLGPFIYRMIESGNEADEAADKTFDFTRALDVLSLNAATATKAMEQLAQETRNAIKVQGDLTEIVRANATNSVASLEQRLDALQRLEQELSKKSSLNVGPLGVITGGVDLYRLQGIRDEIEQISDALKDANKAVVDSEIAAAQSRVIERLDKAAAATAEYERAVGRLNEKFRQSIEDPISATQAGLFITKDEYQAEFERITTLRDATIEAIREAERESKKAGERVFADFILPVSGATVTGRFGEQRSGHKHGGLDLAAPTGTEIRAPQVGTVEAVGYSKTLGKYVVIDHGGGTKTRFGHLSDNAVVGKGDAVEQGALIGRVGSTGRSTGPHLHYEVLVNGKRVDPTKGRFPIDDVKVAEAAEKARAAAERELQKLIDFGDRSAESIARINERFDEQPRLIDQASRATRQLDQTIAELSERKPPGFEELIRQAEEAKSVIEDALVRPFEQLREETEKRWQIDQLLLAGREDEAAVLEEIWRFEDLLGDLTKAQKDDIEEIVLLEQERLRWLEKQHEMQSAYLDATRSVRSELESLFAGESVDFGRIFKRLQARVTVESIFGDSLDRLDDEVQRRFDLNVDYLARENTRAARSIGDLANAATRAAQILNDPQLAQVQRDFDAQFGSAVSVPTASNDNEIVVKGTREGIEQSNSALALSPEQYAVMLGKSLVDPLLAGLPPAMAKSLSGVLGPALGGYFAAGPAGGVFGGLKGLFGTGGLFGLPDDSDILKFADGAFGGAIQGSQIDGILDALGLKSSNTGAAIGGALGSVFGPAGSIVGSIAGGLIGGLIGGQKRGSAIIGGSGSSLDVTGYYGDNQQRKDAAGDLAGSAIDAVGRIAEALGVSIDASRGSVSIGIRDNNYRVDPQGRGYTKIDAYPDIMDFGEDAEAAVRAAALNLIEDGVIQGLSDAEERLLRQGESLEAALQDVLDFRGVLDRLKAYKDPVGAAIDELNREFERYIDLFERAGASAEQFAQLEELYGIERAKAIEEATDRFTSSLGDLLRDLNIGDSGLSLRDRRANALAEYEGLADRVRAGDVTAYDDFADAARALLDIERQLFGSTEGYFERFDEVRALTQAALDEQNRISQEAANRDSPFSEGSAAANDNIVNSITQLETGLLDGLGSKLDAVNRNLGAISLQLGQNSYAPILPNLSVGNW